GCHTAPRVEEGVWKRRDQIRLPHRGVDLTLAVEAGRTLALLGPNGAGKSTALATIAGLLRPTSGQITLDDRILFSGNDSANASGHGEWVPPHARGIALL